MKDSYKSGEIILNEEVSKKIYKLVLDGEFSGEAGQFYMVKGWDGLDPLLPRPISIADIDKGKLTLLYEVRGRGTDIISRLKPGDELSLLGPLGKGFDLDSSGKIALVSGGIGIAPLLYLSKSLNVKVDLYCGFREEAYFIDEFRKNTSNIYISTEKGQHGHKGFITDLVDPDLYNKIYSCGPMAMMESLYKKTKDKSKLELSMENRMACGVGVCLGCTIKTKNSIKRVCKEGPVFKGDEVIFND